MYFKKTHPPSPSLRNAISNKCKQFSRHCTVHGVYYFTSGRWWIHLIWCLILAGSLALCSFLSHMIWSKFIVNPTFTVVESTRYPLENIPFPAVSICDTDVVYGPNTDNITKILKLRAFNVTQIEEFYKSFSDIKDKDYEPKAYVKKMHGILEELGFSYDVLVYEMRRPCEAILKQCVWRSQLNDCTDMFRQVFSVVGYCCQFDLSYFRRRAKNDTNFLSGVEITEAMDIVVDSRRDGIDKSSDVDGYLSLYVFDEVDELTLLDSPISITPSTYIDVALEVWAIDSSSDVRALSVKNRKCFLKEDRGINARSYQDCMTKLIMRKVVEICRCLPFKYKSADLGVESFPPCPWIQLSCIYLALDGVQGDIRGLMSQGECYQKCDYVQYSTEAEYLKKERDTRVHSEGYSRITVHFGDTSCMKYRREVLYTWDQMLANLGGIFGLCLGGSIISIIEILWFILDLFCTIVSVGLKKIIYRVRKEHRHPRIATEKHVTFKVSPENLYENGRLKFVN